ncbi:hypothetical protein K461DRAFT_280165 [Myriangium duriaei CBS 260.36]|uniref:Methyltransferase type 11 domain-containing protein n=1 Tax=Myriangium duriaei CBS 260.36 TaxID=1168546 RepID=A0A9P4J137_9PEZI|nr:hypothetical protein K461DRAFT_280165 [Myriangium duriaei CBS 260.36]
MTTLGQTNQRTCPLVRTTSFSRPLQSHNNISNEERRGRNIPLKLITPVAHGKVRNGPGSSALTKTSISDCSTQFSSIWSHNCEADQDDDLYNLTEDESVVVPLAASASVKKEAAKIKSKYPGLIIPPPEQWPTPPRWAKQPTSTLAPASIAQQSLSPTRAPAANKSRPLRRIPSRTSTPSLDGSLTSEELAMSSCPSTPEVLSYSPKPDEWTAPAQLDAEAYAVLCQLAASSGRGSNNSSPRTSPAIPQEAFAEMSEIARECAGRPQRRSLGVAPLFTSSDPVSALSVPSPSTFFGSLHPTTRQTWCVGGTPPPPSTGTAERFYTLPWKNESPLAERRPIQETRPNATRKDSLFSTIEGIEATEITDNAFTAASQQNDDSGDRTKLWLHSQWAWMAHESVEVPADKLRSCFSPETITPSTPKTTAPDTASFFENTPSSKKSVRFLESVPEAEEPKEEQFINEAEPLFLQGFCYATTRSKSKDTFLQRQARAEASHMFSSTRPGRHSAQLRGEFEIKDVKQSAPSRPISKLVQTPTEDDEFKSTIASVERERQALDQVMPSVWELQAARQVFGSHLIAQPIAEQLKSRSNMRILDYGGGASCDWAWAVALQYRTSTVFTVTSSPIQPSTPLSGPPNHRIVRSNSPISLPFPDNHFDLVSARSLHTMLHTRFPDPDKFPGIDEYDFVLHEFMRVLKPGGFFEYQLMDAELLQPGPLGTALGSEFATSLRQCSYDPQASRYFLPRLRNVGFSDVKRAWFVLPTADVVPTWIDRGKTSGAGSTCPTPATSRTWTPRHGRKDSAVSTVQDSAPCATLPETPVVGSTESVRAMTGLMGARAWERWIVTLQREVGGDEEGMLGRVNRALEEGGRVGAGWKCLVGWARKSERE